jgi:hypothetical protein
VLGRPVDAFIVEFELNVRTEKADHTPTYRVCGVTGTSFAVALARCVAAPMCAGAVTPRAAFHSPHTIPPPQSRGLSIFESLEQFVEQPVSHRQSGANAKFVSLLSRASESYRQRPG